MLAQNTAAFCSAVEAMVRNGTDAVPAWTLVSTWVMQNRRPTPEEMALASAPMKAKAEEPEAEKPAEADPAKT